MHCCIKQAIAVTNTENTRTHGNKNSTFKTLIKGLYNTENKTTPNKLPKFPP